jgi:recombination protein RecA
MSDEKNSRKEKLEKFLQAARKEHGQSVIITASDKRQKVDVFSTGSPKIDIATGVGGFPRGRITEVYGAESSGKTTLALHAAANCQKGGEGVLFVDTEHALDPKYAKNLGINLDDLAVCQPDTGEQGLDVIKFALESGAFGLIVLDSVASLTPRVVSEGEMGDANVGVLPRLMSKACPQFAKLALESNTALVMINQIREKIGVTYGSPNTTPGGRALKFFASMRIEASRSTLQKDGEEVVGNTVKVKIVKNKIAPPFKECEPEVVYGEGFSRERDLLDLGIDSGDIERAGAWYTVNEERVQGKDRAIQYLLMNQAYCDTLQAKLMAALG